jgi:PAS domain S-box-containing protein
LDTSLEGEKAKSSFILNAIEDGVVLIDDQRIIRLFNPAASKITGWPQKDTVGLDYRNVIRLVDEKNQPYADGQDPFQKAVATGKTVRDNKAFLVTRSDKRVAANISISPLMNESQQVTGTVGIIQDVSEQRQEERQRAEFISTASHEMRTPVAAIEGYLALAMNDKLSTIDSKARGYLEKAHTSTQHLGKLFQDLLTSARAEDGRLSSRPVVIEMGKFLEQMVGDLRFAAEKRQLGMEFLVGSGGGSTIDARDANSKVVQPLYYALADPDRLREVITNLFDNAAKYTETGKITLGITGNNEVVQFYVQDTGAGIAAEDMVHLFQKFYRVDNSMTHTVGGTGLGLFICRKIVELYGGRIWVESEVGKGSTFFVNLPRLDANRAAQLQASQAAQNIAPMPISTTSL